MRSLYLKSYENKNASEADDLFGIFCLKMQNDGNLVQYPVDTANSAPYAYYATDLHNSSNRLRNITRGGYVEKGPPSIC
ncbi:hypothetical protein KY290_000404 [Solanum tuberosum]|uniref:Uncharacterized protein n=1 Tax=Solanum tuberosum TaxID=4113 RepID=A0ABQ7WJA3_SOLTU|nr:hypothetical protein KY284_025182 [Solanum tuberosum]KAH0780806.1 hypothetical protein KY290_000404 [Solanum tuberosum]